MALLERGRVIDLVEIKQQPLDLRTNLLPEALERYDALGPNLQESHAQLLSSVTRMGNLREAGFLVSPDFVETNKEHVGMSLEMASEYSRNYPILNEWIDFSSVQSKLLHHDDAEIIIGDVPPVNRTPDEERMKKLEHRVATRYVFSQIPDSQVKEEIIRHYKQYASDNPRDLDVQMTRFIDKAQGTTRVADVAFNIRHHLENGDEATANAIRLHLWNTVPRMMQPAFHLMTYLPAEEARAAMGDIVTKELDRLASAGATEVVRTYRQSVTQG